MSDHSDNLAEIPEHLWELFWEYDVSDLNWDEHRDFIARRVLSDGTWEQLCWLREELGDAELRGIIERSEGRDLSPRQLRFWQLVLGIPKPEVDRWIHSAGRQVWDRRV